MRLTTFQLIENLSNFPTEVDLAAKNQEMILANLKYELGKLKIDCKILKDEEKLTGVLDYCFDLYFMAAKTRCRFSAHQIETVHFAELINLMLNDLYNATISAKPKLVFQAVELPKWPNSTTETTD